MIRNSSDAGRNQRHDAVAVKPNTVRQAIRRLLRSAHITLGAMRDSDVCRFRSAQGTTASAQMGMTCGHALRKDGNVDVDIFVKKRRSIPIVSRADDTYRPRRVFGGVVAIARPCLAWRSVYTTRPTSTPLAWPSPASGDRCFTTCPQPF